ncbi:MAG: ferritin family protein [Desulfuromonadales bacterium]|nr:ferritin family protein [Desulfuromonadales bacterium]NIR34059.1 ferritin family protein [Desulfuromonadales bacterium]NIS44110.1 ferritin family protein [Desulfuromonadales bacterium]
MSEQTSACFTFEAAIEKAIEMEENGFRNYLKAIRMVKDKAAKKILRDAALDELDHKTALERALLEGSVDAAHNLEEPVPTMNLDYLVGKKELGPDAGGREALAYAIHLEKDAVQFYKDMSSACAGAPMADIFNRIGNDETRHLQTLEDLYEKHFLPEG